MNRHADCRPPIANATSPHPAPSSFPTVDFLDAPGDLNDYAALLVAMGAARHDLSDHTGTAHREIDWALPKIVALGRVVLREQLGCLFADATAAHDVERWAVR